MTETMRTILVLFAMFLGLVSNFLFPYLRKLILENKIDQIDLKYVVHLVIAACWQFLFGFAVYSQWQPPSGIVNEALLYILAYAFGFGGSEIQKEVGKFLNDLRRNPVEAITELVTPDPPLPTSDDTNDELDKLIDKDLKDLKDLTPDDIKL